MEMSGLERKSGRCVRCLDEMAGLLNTDAALKIYVDGYTDSIGLPQKNQVLSDKRAGAVKTYLVGKGISADRILAKGHGPADPIASNKTVAGRAQNRRVELKLDYQ